MLGGKRELYTLHCNFPHATNTIRINVMRDEVPSGGDWLHIDHSGTQADALLVAIEVDIDAKGHVVQANKAFLASMMQGIRSPIVLRPQT